MYKNIEVRRFEPYELYAGIFNYTNTHMTRAHIFPHSHHEVWNQLLMELNVMQVEGGFKLECLMFIIIIVMDNYILFIVKKQI